MRLDEAVGGVHRRLLSSDGTEASENTTDEKKAFVSFVQIVEATNRN